MRPSLAIVPFVLCAALLAACGEDKAKIDDLNAQIAQLRAENDRLAADLKAAQAAQQQSGAGVADLQKQIADATGRLADLSNQLDAAKLAATSAQARYEEALSRLASAEARAAELQATLDQTADRCQREVEALRSELASVQDQLAAALKALEDTNVLKNLMPRR